MNGKSYPSVSLLAPRNCCAAVKGLDGRRILAASAPNLPLSDCSMPGQCRCRFQKYSDRRGDEENRRFPYASERSAWYSGAQRRKSRGRRRGD